MANIRIGHGYDVHRLTEGRRLILGGVDIPHPKGLMGHSDADVLTHAVMDSVLGALALGDIGTHFPDSDLTFLNANSLELLDRVVSMMTRFDYHLSNLDATIIAQEPRLASHIAAMRRNLSVRFGVDPSALNLKATTEETLGFTGAKEGIAAHCVCLLERNSP